MHKVFPADVYYLSSTNLAFDLFSRSHSSCGICLEHIMRTISRTKAALTFLSLINSAYQHVTADINWSTVYYNPTMTSTSWATCASTDSAPTATGVPFPGTDRDISPCWPDACTTSNCFYWNHDSTSILLTNSTGEFSLSIGSSVDEDSFDFYCFNDTSSDCTSGSINLDYWWKPIPHSAFAVVMWGEGQHVLILMLRARPY